MRVFENICFIIFGAIISFIPSYYNIPFYIIILLALILLLFGLGFLELILYGIDCFFRSINKNKFCIYAPHKINDPQTASWVNLELKDILNFFKDKKIKYEHIKKESKMKQFPITLNPYGGVYPEKNTEKLTSLDNIFEYVKSGGIYINIADIPFYYAYDNHLGRRIDTTPQSGELGEKRAFLNVILSKRLHTFIDANSYSINKINVKRSFTVSTNSKNLFNNAEKPDEYNRSPYIAITYGKGFFLFSTFEINLENIDRLETIINDSFNLMSGKVRVEY